MIDISALNAYVIFTQNHPDWSANRMDKRRHFLIELGMSMLIPYVRQRLLHGLSREIRDAILVVFSGVDKPVVECDIRKAHVEIDGVEAKYARRHLYKR